MALNAIRCPRLPAALVAAAAVAGCGGGDNGDRARSGRPRGVPHRAGAHPPVSRCAPRQRRYAVPLALRATGGRWVSVASRGLSAEAKNGTSSSP